MAPISHKTIQKDLQKLATPKKAKFLQGFFKTGKGQYAEGDVMLGIAVPEQRKVAKRHYKEISSGEVVKLLKSKIHEYRLTALLIFVLQFEKGDDAVKTNIYNLYLKNIRYVNNWDLVDLSAPKIVGAYLMERDRKILYTLAKSDDLWEKRIAMLATYTFIKTGDFEDALKIATMLVDDSHDLIHKAVGWMLREIGKIDQLSEEEFLKIHYKTMPRTMLRYAIEKFDDQKRKFYMGK